MSAYDENEIEVIFYNDSGNDIARDTEIQLEIDYKHETSLEQKEYKRVKLKIGRYRIGVQQEINDKPGNGWAANIRVRRKKINNPCL